MPGYKVHLWGGALTGLLLVYAEVPALMGIRGPSPLLNTFAVLLCCIGALIPDIDTKSKGRRILDRLVMLALVYAGFMGHRPGMGICIIGLVIPRLLKHRGITHRPWFIGFVLLVSLLMLKRSGILWHQEACVGALFLCAGALSHILLDYQPLFKQIFKQPRR